MPNGHNPLLPTPEQIREMRRLGLNPVDVVAGPALRAFNNYMRNEPEGGGRRYIRHEEAPFQTQLSTAAAATGQPHIAAVSGMINSMLDLFGAGEDNIAETGDVSPTARTIDPTDPSISRSQLTEDGIELTPQEIRLRRVKRLFGALKGTLTSPTVIPTSSGIQQDIQLGNLAEAETLDEKVVDEVAIILANMGVFAPLGLGIGTSETATAVLGGEAAGGAALLGRAGEAAVANIPKAAGQALGRTPLRILAEKIAGRTALSADDVLTRFANVGIDAAFGAGFGVAETEGYEAVTGEKLTMGEKAASIGIMGGAGLALGTVLHGGGAYLANRRAAQLNEVLSGSRLPLQAGDVVGGREYLGPGPGSRWKWTAEGEGPTGKFAKAPPDEAIEAAHYKLVEDIADRLAAAETADAVIEAGGEIPSPRDIQTTPRDLQGEFPQMHTMAAAYWPHLENRVNRLVRQRGILANEVLAREAEETRAIFMNSALSETERATAGARLLAIEQLIGEGGADAVSNMAIERAALGLAREGRVRGTGWVQDQVASLRSYGDNAVADRLEAIVAAGIPEADHRAVLARLKQADKRASRGFWQGSKVITEDGKVIQLVERPVYGAARGRVLGEPGEGLVTVDLSTARALPEPGKTVWLGEEKGILRVDEIKPETGEFVGTNPITNERSAHPLSSIVATSDSPAAAKTMAQMQAEWAAELYGDVTPVTPTEAVTAEGEKVVVTGVGQDAVEVQAKGGKRRKVAKGDVKPSRATQPGEIVDYAPGTLPRQDPEKHKLLFAEVPKGQQEAFEGAVRGRMLPESGLTVNTHVLPPNPSDDAALYAVELPSRQVPKKLYSEEANRAVRALGGSGTVESYHSPIAVPPDRLQRGQFYRISDDLRATAQQPEEALASMAPGDQQKYLRHLAVMNEDVWSEVAKPAAKSRAARKARNKAVKGNDGQAFNEAEVAMAENDAEAVKAALRRVDEPRQQAEEAVYADIQSRSDDAPIRRQFEEVGLTDETRDYYGSQIGSLHANDPGVIPEDQLILLHRQNPGERLVITKRRQVRGPTPEAPEAARGIDTYYDVESIDSFGASLWSERYHNPEHIISQIEQNGFIGTLTKIQRGRWMQRGAAPKMIADIYPRGRAGTAAGEEVLTRIEKRIELPRGEGRITPEVRQQAIEAALGEGAITPQEAEFAQKMVDMGINVQDLREAQLTGYTGEGPRVPNELTEAAERVWVSISNKAQELGSGGIVNREISRKSFGSMAEAEAYLRSEDFIQVRDISPDMATDIGSPIMRFDGLPPLEDVVKDPELMLRLAHDVEWIVNTFNAEQRYIPDPVRHYAREFGKAFYEETGAPLFNREIREALTIPTLKDLGPKMARPVDLQSRELTTAFERLDSVDGAKFRPEMHLSAPTPTLKTDPKYLYADVMLHNKVPGESIIDNAVRMHRQQALQTDWVAAVRPNQHGTETSFNLWAPENKAYGRYKPTGQAVEIVDANIAGDNALVRFPDGMEKEVAKTTVKVARHKSYPGDGLQYEMAAKLAQGDYSGFVHREPPLGYGELEQDLGLLGTNSLGALRERAFARIDELVSGLNFRSGAAAGPPEAVEELVQTFKRLQRFGKPVEKVSRAGGKRHKVTKRVTLFDEAIQRLPKEQRKPMQYAIRQRIKGEYGNSPLGEVIARAWAGELTPKQAAALRAWGTANNVPETTPLGKVAEESLVRGDVHKTAAHIFAKFRKDAGFIGLSTTDVNLPYGRLTLKYPRVNDIGAVWSRFFGINHHVAERHPLSRMVMDAIRAAEEAELRRTSTGAMVLRELEGFGYKEDDLRAIKRLMTEHDTWQDALSAGADERLGFGYSRFKEHFETSKEDMIRYYMRRSIQPVPFDKSNERLVNYVAQHMGYDPDKIADGALFLMPNPHDLSKAGVTAGGMQQSKWTGDQIEEFIRLLRQYPDAASLPEGLDETFSSMFNFWKGWGIKNYWPLVHEGNVAIYRQLADGTEELLGWAPTVPDAFNATRELAGNGKINFDVDNIAIRETRTPVDDIMLRHVPGKELERTVGELAKLIDFSPDDVRALFVRAEGYTPTRIKNPYLANAMTREMNLEPIFNDPWREFQVYNARLARSHYRMDLMDAHRMIENPQLDASLSEAWGVAKLSEMRNLKRYMLDDVLPTALGERTAAERQADSFMATWNAINHSPKWLWDRALKRGEFGEMDWQAWRQLWGRTYGARGAAGDVIGFQASYRLWGSPSSALANATQHWINTAPMIMGDGVSAVDAMKLSTGTWLKAIRLWRAQTANQFRSLSGKASKPIPKELEAIAELADEAGVLLMPGKHLAGAGGHDWTALANEIPIGFGRRDRILGIPGLNARTKDIVDYMGMLMFNGAERVNRFSALVAGYEKATKVLGMGHEAAVKYANRLVRDTQFYYDDLSMPQLFTKLGPAGRILFQFKGYIWNQVNFEARLAKRAFAGDADAMKKLTAHLGMYTVLGGVRGLASHPIISAMLALAGGAASVAGLSGGWKDPTAWMMAKWRQRRIDNRTPEEAIEHQMPGMASDIVMHGLPGLLHATLGQRIGISGQEIGNLVDLTNWATLGPHLSVYGDFFELMKGYNEVSSSRAGMLGAGAAAVASLVVPQAVTKGVLTGVGLAQSGFRAGGAGAGAIEALRSGEGQAGVQRALKESGYATEAQDLSRFLTWGTAKYPTMAAALLGGQLASQGSALDFGTYYESSAEGRKFRQRSLPTFIRAWSNAVEIFSNGALLDIDGKPTYLNPGRDTWEEVSAAFLNLPTIRREEQRAAVSLLLKENESAGSQRTRYLDAIGRALSDGQLEQAYNLLYEAMQQGITIEESSLQRELDSRTQEALETIRQRVLQEVRYD